MIAGRTVAAVALAALLLLAGCNPSQKAAAPLASKSIAPTLPGAQTGASQSAGAQQPRTQQVNSQRDQQLIDSVESAYKTGMSNYQGGHLVAARQNFDYAVDLMLSSGIDIRNDPAIDDEFERIVDAVNTLELEALKQGTGLSPAAEPTPVDVANDVTFPVDPGVKATAVAELKTTQSDLPLVVNDYVASYINFFSNSAKGHNTIVASLTRAGRYKAIIQNVLKEEGVPQDLIYQAVAESGFRTMAVNPRSGAGGMWQFMPYGTYGLVRNAWYDERFDPEKATHAYAREIKKMYDQLGDWYLAMAAYDWGPGNIQRAVQRTGYADFWELYRRNNLPAETKNYVPIILAVTVMAKNPKQYGLSDLTPDPPLLMDTVQTDYAIDLRLVADIVGAPVQEIAGLNPSLLRSTTPPDEPFDLHLPPGTKDLFEKEIAMVPEDKRRFWRLHKVVPGDTLESIARSYRASSSEISAVNQLTGTDDLTGVDTLVIPMAPASLPSSARTALYRSRRGDTLVTVADRFGVTVRQLREWNHLRGSMIAPGRSLYVAEPAHVSRQARSRHTGTVSMRQGRASGTRAQASKTLRHTAAADPKSKRDAKPAGHRHVTSAQASTHVKGPKRKGRA